MPHDSQGKPVEPGDEVTIRFRVETVGPGDEDECNCSLRAIDVGDHDVCYLPHVSCSTKLVTACRDDEDEGFDGGIPDKEQ